MSMSTTRLSSRARLMHAGALCVLPGGFSASLHHARPERSTQFGVARRGFSPSVVEQLIDITMEAVSDLPGICTETKQ